MKISYKKAELIYNLLNPQVRLKVNDWNITNIKMAVDIRNDTQVNGIQFNVKTKKHVGEVFIFSVGKGKYEIKLTDKVILGQYPSIILQKENIHLYDLFHVLENILNE